MGSDIQFDRAEYPDAGPGAVTCAGCSQPIVGAYWQVNGRTVCERCLRQIEWQERHGGSGIGRFALATVLGTVAAIIGSTLYFAVRAVTGWEVGLISIVVGILVGIAVRKGARGRGGWLYQGLAMFLTYSAIVATYVPMAMKAFDESVTRQGAQTGAASPAGAGDQGAPSSRVAPRSALGRGLLIIAAFIVSYALPFLVLTQGFDGILGLFIIGIGVYEAWKINKRQVLDISGPFRVGSVVGVS